MKASRSDSSKSITNPLEHFGFLGGIFMRYHIWSCGTRFNPLLGKAYVCYFTELAKSFKPWETKKLCGRNFKGSP